MTQKKEIYLRCIGDVHGMISKKGSYITYKSFGRTYLDLIKKCEYSIQLGDMGFDYEALAKVDGSRHLWIGGNHDNYDVLRTAKINGYLGDFGFNTTIPNFPFFYIRGANSVDKQYRIEGVSWWREEELSYQQGLACIHSYEKIRPEIVISHDCPQECIENVITNSYKILGSRTNTLLGGLLEIWQPKFWLFGHHHKNKTFKIDGVRTLFICLNELSYIDVAESGKLKFLNGR